MEKKKIFRSETDKKIAGVCGGMAAYFNIDPTIIRVIWAFVGLWAGAGLLAYLVCALIIPTESAV